MNSVPVSNKSVEVIDVKQQIRTMAERAKAAAPVIARASSKQKNDALLAIAAQILANRDSLMQKNQLDLDAAKKNGISEAMLDRLTFTEARFDAMVEGLHQVAALQDPIGEITDLAYRPSGIQVGKMRTPLGVIGIIYESRPNVTIDAAALCLKSGNATVLRGGSEAIHSNQALALCIQAGLEAVDLPADVVQIVPFTDRAAVGELITSVGLIDVIVPRGGIGLTERIANDAKIPVIKHLDGICHVYIDGQVDKTMALDIAVNAKCNRYAVCNTMETLLISEAVVAEILPELGRLYIAEGVELRGCEKTVRALDKVCEVKAAEPDDWRAEYLAPILSIKVVADVDEAIRHINQYSSKHTDCIVTEHYGNSQRFLREVDSSSVMVNASPRFADGFEYGLGAEIGISTDKLHARGPVGLEGLTSQKFVVFGSGQIRQ